MPAASARVPPIRRLALHHPHAVSRLAVARTAVGAGRIGASSISWFFAANVRKPDTSHGEHRAERRPVWRLLVLTDRIVQHYQSRQVGGRFCRKAAMPSAASFSDMLQVIVLLATSYAAASGRSIC
jgi:hypothetical protein